MIASKYGSHFAKPTYQDEGGGDNEDVNVEINGMDTPKGLTTSQDDLHTFVSLNTITIKKSLQGQEVQKHC
jgi:hypothetical protein